jgi:DNA-binding HxlR family transcriptional regulator
MAKKVVGCPVETAIEVIGGRWKVLILQELFAGTRRFSELHRALSGVSHRTLTQQLRELESHSIVRRKVHRQIPPKVEYSLTPVGETLKPVIAVMHNWAEGYSRNRTNKSKGKRDVEA